MSFLGKKMEGSERRILLDKNGFGFMCSPEVTFCYYRKGCEMS